MITLYSGVPGSGKTYKMIAELSRVKDKYYVVHNIDGLVDGYLGNKGINFLDYCKENSIEVEEFFSKEYQIEFTQRVREKYDRPCLVIIDEAHEWFSNNKKTLKMWLSYHRHLDQQIWLVAHRSTNLPAIYRSFIEIEYRAKSGAFLGIPGFFFYNRILGGQPAGYIKERKKQKTFDLYKSALASSKVNQKKPKFLIMILAGSICLVAIFILLPQYMMRPDASAAENKKPDRASGRPELATGRPDLATGRPDRASARPDLATEISEKYAYVGNLAGRIVLEDRRTGEMIYVERFPERITALEIDRDNSVLIWVDKISKTVLLTNSNRHVPVEASGRQLSRDASTGLQSIAQNN